MIVKCQCSQFTTQAAGQMLFYTEGKVLFGQFEMTEDWANRFDPEMIDGCRFFAEVNWPDANMPPTFVRMVSEQGW